MDSVKLQELINDPKNLFMIVTKIAESDGTISEETEATYQKVMDAIKKTDRPLPDPKIYLAAKDFNNSVEGTQTIKGSPLFVLWSTTTDKLVITETPLDPEMRTRVLHMSDIMLAVKCGGVYLIRSKAYPTNIRVEV